MNNLFVGAVILAAGFAGIALIKWGRLSYLVDRGVRGTRMRRYDDIGLLARYHRAIGQSAESLDDRTWSDLDMDQVLEKIDHTESTVGAQMLYDRLRAPTYTAQFSELVEELRANPAVAKQIRAAVRPLDRSDAAWLPDLFTGDAPRQVTARWIYSVLSGAMVIALAATPFYRLALVAIVALAFVNSIITLVFKRRIQLMLPGLRALPKLARAGEQIARIETTAPAVTQAVETLRLSVGRLGRLRGAAHWLLFEPGEAPDLQAALYEYVNMLFLFSVNAVAVGIEQIRDQQSALRETYETIGRLDVAQAVAALRDTWTNGTRPEIETAVKQVDVVDVWHPLLEAPVANSISVAGASVLVTGSNMSGKTTFVRTLGVAAVLARSIDTVPAKRWRAPALIPLTSIARSDSLIEGKSYYLTEVERIRELIVAKDDGRPHLFLLDEIFRGTNTTERVAAGKAVLAELDRGDDLVVVATHDLELLPMLAGRFIPYHFREEVDGEALRFDYAIKSGPSSTRNAIALLRLMKYPDRVVEDALATVNGDPHGQTRLVQITTAPH